MVPDLYIPDLFKIWLFEIDMTNDNKGFIYRQLFVGLAPGIPKSPSHCPLQQVTSATGALFAQQAVPAAEHAAVVVEVVVDVEAVVAHTPLMQPISAPHNPAYPAADVAPQASPSANPYGMQKRSDTPASSDGMQ